MAAVTGTIVDVAGAFCPSGPKKTTAGAKIECYLIDVTFAGTYASAGNFSIATVGAGIAAARRDGRTYTIIDAGFAAPGDLNGSMVGADTVAISTTSITGQLTQGDMTTEWADGLMSTAWNEGVKFWVLCTVA